MKMMITVFKLKLSSLILLFIKPKTFFAEHQSTHNKLNIFIAAFCYGIYHTLNRFDELLLKESFNRPWPGWELLSPLVDGPWTDYWLFLLVIGFFAAIVAYYLGGWWYWVRLKLAAKIDTGNEAEEGPPPDKKTARLIYIYSQFVMGFPPLMMLAAQTLIYNNYRQAWSADLGWFAVLALLPYWSCLVSYHGAMHYNPQLSKAKAMVWFVICPALSYLSMQYLFWQMLITKL
jgi:hypothetical protein